MTAAVSIRLLEMVALGAGAATIGSLAGLGGGFIVGPALRLFFALPPDEAAATSLVLVLSNVASASIAFVRQGRVDLRLAAIVGVFAIPTSVLGAFVVHGIDAAWFDVLYAAMLGFFALTLLRGSETRAEGRVVGLWWGKERVFADRVSGREFHYAESDPIAAGAGLLTGFVSSFFGIGGGTVVVPLLLRLFAMPAHVVSATSHMIILISAPFGVAAHAFDGDIAWPDALPLALGGLAGGQIGAVVSKRVPGVVLVRLVATLLGAAAISLFAQHAGALHGR